MPGTIEALREELEKDLSKVDSLEALSALKRKYLSSEDGIFRRFFKKIPELPKDKRAEFGRELNGLKQKLEEFLDTKRKQLQEEALDKADRVRDIDLSAPWNINAKLRPSPVNTGAKHPITLEIEKFIDVFIKLGFDVYEGRELDSEYYNFESLAMPANHPAREMWDTFYTEEGLVPSVHTSNMQVRLMRMYKKPPIRAVVYSKCARNEETDATHSHTFHQIEGIYIDKGVTISNMLAILNRFLEGLLETKIVSKVQVAHFPFVEPGLEMVIRCVFCEGKGCPSCKYSGWLEILGAGMIHPEVLKNGGIDPEKYTGIAWGLGVERLVMNKNNIGDIRLLYKNDLRLLKPR